jgi:hypothetical protein
MTIEKTNTNKSVVELRKELGANGTTIENVYVDGQKFCCVGYVSERDKNACLKAIQAAVDGSENLYEAMQKLMVSANLTDHEIEPDEEIECYGQPMFVSYANKAIYDTNGEEVVNCRELECDLPPEACKTILMQRLELAMQEEELDLDGFKYEE